MNDNFERFFILTNPLYWVYFVLIYPCHWIAIMIGSTRGFIKDYLFLRNEMGDLTTEQLERCIKYCNSKKWHKQWTDRKIKEKAKKMLQSN